MDREDCPHVYEAGTEVLQCPHCDSRSCTDCGKVLRCANGCNTIMCKDSMCVSDGNRVCQSCKPLADQGIRAESVEDYTTQLVKYFMDAVEAEEK